MNTRNASVRLQTFVMVALPLVLPIVFMVWLQPSAQRESLLRMAEQKARAMTAVFAANAAAPLSFDDSQALDKLLKTAKTDEDVVYIFGAGTDGKVLAGENTPKDLAAFTATKELTVRFDGSLFHVSAPVTVGAQAIGMLHAGYSAERLTKEADTFRNSGLLLTLVVLVLSGIVAVVLGRSFAGLFDRMRNSLLETARRVDEVVHQLATVTAEQSTAATEESTALNESNQTANDVGQASNAAALRASTLVDSGAKAEEGTVRGLQAVTAARASMGEVREQMSTIETTVSALSGRAAAIGEIAGTVAMLAERSNLLALNAAIEAARAGTQGRGFAVVAQEMRSLADGSNRSAAQVKTIISEIQQVIGRAQADAREGERRAQAAEKQSEVASETIRQFTEVVREFVITGKEIAASSTQQKVAIEQMVESIVHAAEAGRTQLETTRQVEATTLQLRDLSKALLGTVTNATVANAAAETDARRMS